MNRRSFFALTAKAGGALIAAALAIPAAITAFSPVIRRTKGEVWAPVGEIGSFPVDEVSKAVVEAPWDEEDQFLREKGVFVWRQDGEDVVVFSRSCTDLSCPVTWDPGSGWFFCPCHGGIFDEEGKNVAGPPPRPLHRYAKRVRDGVLEIDLNSLPPVT